MLAVILYYYRLRITHFYSYDMYDYIKLFRKKLFSYFLTLIHIDLRLGHSDIHIDTTSHWLACRPIRSKYAATLPAHHLYTVPSIRTLRTMELCIVSHYRNILHVGLKCLCCCSTARVTDCGHHHDTYFNLQRIT